MDSLSLPQSVASYPLENVSLSGMRHVSKIIALILIGICLIFKKISFFFLSAGPLYPG